ncbi:MAG: hypothetical protein R6W69_05530 [Anaerolineales bacterium]
MDEIKESSPEPTMESPINGPMVTPAPVKESNKNLWIIAGLAISIICVCSFCCIALIGISGAGFGAVMNERAPVELVLDAFMKNMEAQDIENAYALFSPRVQREISVDDVQKMIGGNNYVLFDGYQSLSVRNLKLSSAANTNPKLPQGTVANVDGVIEYSGDFSGNFTAILEKVDGDWMIHQININVPPDKFQP